MYHNIGDQDSAYEDATYVLENIDAKNPKALLRRSFAHRTNLNWVEAVMDLQKLNNISTDPTVKKDLDFCMGKYMGTIRQKNQSGGAQKPDAKPAPKAAPKAKPSIPLIKEVENKPSDFKKV